MGDWWPGPLVDAPGNAILFLLWLKLLYFVVTAVFVDVSVLVLL